MNTFDKFDLTLNGIKLTLAIKHLIQATVSEAENLTYNDLTNLERMFTRGMVNAVALAKGKQSIHRPIL